MTEISNTKSLFQGNRTLGRLCIGEKIQGGSNMTGTDFCVNKPHMSRSYLNHLVVLKQDR